MLEDLPAFSPSRAPLGFLDFPAKSSLFSVCFKPLLFSGPQTGEMSYNGSLSSPWRTAQRPPQNFEKAFEIRPTRLFYFEIAIPLFVIVHNNHSIDFDI